MSRSQSLMGALILVMTVLTFTWQPSRANDDKNSVEVNNSISGLAEEKLIERIELLEQRIRKLERLETLVRQVDNTDGAPIPIPRELPPLPSEDGKYQPQQTNGTTWSFRTLSQRRTSNLVR